MVLTKKLTPELVFKKKLASLAKVKDLAKNGVWNSLNQIGNVLNSGLDLVISNLMLTGIETGEIAIAKTIEAIFATLFQTISQPFQPALIRSYAKGDMDDFLIIVSDYEAAKNFYVNKLGFSVIRENYRPERKDWKLDLRVNEYTELEIFAEENPPKRVNRPEACGLRHLAFCVESVEQTVRELAEVGIECEPVRVDDYTGKKMTFFHDPDGLPLELHE